MTISSWAKAHTNQLLSLALAVTVVMIAMVQRDALINALRQVRLNWAVAGLGCYAVNYLLRAIRISIVTHKRTHLWPDAAHVACLHGLATYLLPFRSGEFTLPIILNKTSALSYAEGAGVLVTVRLLDLCALGVWILSAAALIQWPLPKLIYGVWVVFGAFLLVLPFVLRWVVRLGQTLQGGFLQKVRRWGSGATTFNGYAFFVSLGIWACIGACLYCTVNAIRLPLGFVDVWLLITIQLPLQMIPLQGVANAGNHEGGWVAGLALIGIPASQGLQFALVSHALLLTYVLSLAPLAFFTRKSHQNVDPEKG